MEIDRVGENLAKDPQKSVPSLLVNISDLFLKLEASIGHFHAMHQVGLYKLYTARREITLQLPMVLYCEFYSFICRVVLL